MDHVRHCPPAGYGFLRPYCHPVPAGTRAHHLSDHFDREYLPCTLNPAGNPLGDHRRQDRLPPYDHLLFRTLLNFQNYILESGWIRRFSGRTHYAKCGRIRLFRRGFLDPLSLLRSEEQPEGLWYLSQHEYGRAVVCRRCLYNGCAGSLPPCRFSYRDQLRRRRFSFPLSDGCPDSQREKNRHGAFPGHNKKGNEEPFAASVPHCSCAVI